MFRLWCKIIDDNKHLLKDVVIENADPELNRTRKIFDGLREACMSLNLSEPIWLDSNVEDFKRHSKVRFIQNNFIEPIDFSYLEIQVIEED